MDFTFPDITPYNYLDSLIILVAFYVASQLVVFVAEKIFMRFASKTQTKVDDLIIQKSNKPISFILILFGTRLALNPLAIAEPVEAIIINLLYSLIGFLLVYVFISVFGVIIDEWGIKFAQKTHSKIDDDLLSIFHRFSKILFIILGLLYILNIWGVEIGPFLASLGIAGVAVAFALQNTLGNIFGGISIILDRTVKRDDIVQLDSGESGRIYDVGLRSTKIKTWNNEIVSVPNGKLANSTIKNVTSPSPSIRIDLTFGVEYGSDPDKVKKVALDTCKKVKEVLKDPAPNIWFTEMADFSLNFKLMFWVNDIAKKWDTHQEVITALYNNLGKNKIGIPFPTHTVYMKK